MASLQNACCGIIQSNLTLRKVAFCPWVVGTCPYPEAAPCQWFLDWKAWSLAGSRGRLDCWCCRDLLKFLKDEVKLTMTCHRSTVWNTIDRIMNYESYSYGLRYFVNDTLHDKFVTNSCNHSGQPRKSSKNVLLYRIQFCGFANAWHPCIPSHNRHTEGRTSECIAWRQTGGCSPTGLLEPSADKSCKTVIVAGLIIGRFPFPCTKNHQLELSTLVWVTWWFSENTFALCCCLHLWSFVDIWYIIYDMFVWFCFYTPAVIFQLVVTPRWAATLDFVSVTCQRSFRDILGSSFVIVSIYGADLKTRGVKRGQHFCLMTRSIPIKKRGSFHFIPCRLKYPPCMSQYQQSQTVKLWPTLFLFIPRLMAA